MLVHTGRRALACVVALIALLAVTPAGASAAAIPPPQQYFGFELGTSGKLARFEKITQYLKLIGDNSTRADYQVLGKTVLGKDMPLMHISSPANLQRVDQILAANDRLADPRGLSEEEAKALAANHIPVYYLEAGMHSTEVGPVQVIPNIVHRLATERSPEINKILNEMLIVLLPAANPDGSHLVTDYFNETANTSFTRTYPDLYHHYTGHDDNRDWLFFTQPESKLRIGVFRKYKPVVEHILHQAGSNNPRMWVPPYNDGISATRDALHMQSTNEIGMDVIRGLYAEDKKGVSSGDAYGIWATADIPSFETFAGSALLLFEAASLNNLAYPFTSTNGSNLGNQVRSMRNLLPYDKPTWTLEQMLDYLETGTFLALSAVAKEPERWSLDNLYRVPRNADALDRGSVRLRDPGRPAGHVRRLRHAQGARAVAGRDPPRDRRVHRRRQDLSGGLLRHQHAPAAGQVGRADHGQPALPGRQELPDLPAADAVLRGDGQHAADARHHRRPDRRAGVGSGRARGVGDAAGRALPGRPAGRGRVPRRAELVRRGALPGRPAEGRRPGLPLLGGVRLRTRPARSSCRRRRGRGWCSRPPRRRPACRSTPPRPPRRWRASSSSRAPRSASSGARTTCRAAG